MRMASTKPSGKHLHVKMASLKQPVMKSPIPSPTRRRLMPFRHPDFTDDQLERLTETKKKGPGAGKDKLPKTLRRLDSSPNLMPPCVISTAQIDSLNNCSTVNNSFFNSFNSVCNATSIVAPVSPTVKLMTAVKKTKDKHVGKECGIPTDGDLMALMMSKVMALENQLIVAQKQIYAKNRKINMLEEKVKILQKARASSFPTDIHELQQKCLQLEHQVQQMQDVIDNCGVDASSAETKRDSDGSVKSTDSGGEKMNYEFIINQFCNNQRKDSSVSATSKDDSSEATLAADCERRFSVDYDVVMENVKDLNFLASDGATQVCFTTQGASFQTVDPLPLTLYANGFCLMSGPFRPFTDESTKQFILDLTDGYFPTELQRKFPEGVPFKVIDKRDVTYEMSPMMSELWRTDCNFLQPLGSSPIPGVARSAPATPLDSPINSSAYPSSQITPLQQLLNRGKMVDDARNLVKSLPQMPIVEKPKPSDITVIITPELFEITEEPESDGNGSHQNNQSESSGDADSNISTLKIIEECNSRTFVLKILANSTIGDLRQHLNQQRQSFDDTTDLELLEASDDYEIACGDLILENEDTTVEDYGMHPYATVTLKKCTNKSSLVRASEMPVNVHSIESDDS